MLNLIQNNLGKQIVAALVTAILFSSLFLSAPQAQAQVNRESMLEQIQQLLQLITALQEQLLQSDATSPDVSLEGGFKGESFSLGDEVITTNTLKVRSIAGVSGILLLAQPASVKGTLVAGPEVKDGYTWWKVSYTSGVTGWSAANWLHATGQYKASSSDTPIAPEVNEKLALEIDTPNSGSYSYGDLLTVTWEQTGEAPKGSQVCVLLRNLDTDKTFALPGDVSCVNVAGTEPTRTLAATLVRTSGYDLTPGRYSVQVTLIGPSVGYKDGATLAVDKSDRAITILTTAPSCEVDTDKVTYNLNDDITISWSTENATRMSFVIPADGKDHLALPGDKLDTSGSVTIPASVIGNPVITMKAAVSIGGDSATCTSRIEILEQENVDDSLKG